MRRIFTSFFLIFGTIGVISVMGLASCSDNRVTGVTLNTASLELEAGSGYTLRATVAPIDATVKTVSWTSSDKSVATVNVWGRVSAITTGKVAIIATTDDGGKTAVCEIIVAPPVSTATVKSSLPIGEFTFLAYNLGANAGLSIEEQMAYTPLDDNTDATVYGDLYQWGRPTDGHEKRTSGTTPTLSDSDKPSHGYFIIAPQSFNWRSPENPNLWGANKTPNDPCPPGYRIPTNDEWASIYGEKSGNTWVYTREKETSGYKISSDGGVTYTFFLPEAGIRSYDQGTIYPGKYLSSGYWSSTDVFTCMYFSDDLIDTRYARPAGGYSCRCVKEY